VALFELYPRAPGTTIRRDHPVAVWAGMASQESGRKSTSRTLARISLWSSVGPRGHRRGREPRGAPRVGTSAASCRRYASLPPGL